MSENNALWRALLSAENPTSNPLSPLWDFPSASVGSPFGSLAPTPTPSAQRVAEALLGYTPLAPKNPLGGLFGLGESIGRPALPIAPYSPPAPAAPVVPIERMTYFAFDFDDIMRVNNVRQSGSGIL